VDVVLIRRYYDYPEYWAHLCPRADLVSPWLHGGPLTTPMCEALAAITADEAHFPDEVYRLNSLADVERYLDDATIAERHIRRLKKQRDDSGRMLSDMRLPVEPPPGGRVRLNSPTALLATWNEPAVADELRAVINETDEQIEAKVAAMIAGDPQYRAEQIAEMLPNTVPYMFERTGGARQSARRRGWQVIEQIDVDWDI